MQANRLKKKTDIERVFTHGTFFRAKGVNVVLWKKGHLLQPERGYTADDLKFAVVVPKKYEKSAVRRNILKRRVREALRLLIKEQNCATGVLGVAMVQASAKEMTVVQIKEALTQLFKKAKLIV